MQGDDEVYVGLDVSKLKVSVALAELGRDGEVGFLGEIENTPEGIGRLVAKLAKRHRRLAFCYEAGPTGYGLHRQVTALGQDHELALAGADRLGERGRHRAEQFGVDRAANEPNHLAGVGVDEAVEVEPLVPMTRPAPAGCSGSAGPTVSAARPAGTTRPGNSGASG